MQSLLSSKRRCGERVFRFVALFIALAVITAPETVQAQKPHWCPGTTATEQAICNDPPTAGGLGQKDLILNSLFSTLNQGTVAGLPAEQAKWRATRDTVTDVALLHVLYDYRINQLRARLVANATPQCAPDASVATTSKPATNFGAGPIPVFVTPTATTPAFTITSGVPVNVVDGALESVDGSGKAWKHIVCNGTYYWIEKSYIDPL